MTLDVGRRAEPFLYYRAFVVCHMSPTKFSIANRACSWCRTVAVCVCENVVHYFKQKGSGCWGKGDGRRQESIGLALEFSIFYLSERKGRWRKSPHVQLKKKREEGEGERISNKRSTAYSTQYLISTDGGWPINFSLCSSPSSSFFEFFNHGILCLFKGSFLSTGRCWAYIRRLFYKTYRQDTSRNGTRMQQSSLRLLDCFLLCALKAIINTFFDFNYRFFSHSLPFSSACYCTYRPINKLTH